MSTPHVEWSRQPSLTSPVMVCAFAGWNDAGDAATWAVRHLHQRSLAEPFAGIDGEEFFDFSDTRPLVELDDDGSRRLLWPANEFSAASEPRSLILLQGIEPQLRWRTFCEQIIGVAQRFDVEMVVTLGALLAEVPHSRPVSVFGSCDDPELGATLNLERSSYEGPTGIVGALHAALGEADIPSASLWSAVPNYVAGAASPKAALALIERLQKLLRVGFPTTDLEIASSAYERQIAQLVSDDEETASYIRTLEESYDEAEEEDADDDPEKFIEDVEAFLRNETE